MRAWGLEKLHSRATLQTMDQRSKFNDEERPAPGSWFSISPEGASPPGHPIGPELCNILISNSELSLDVSGPGI